MEPVLWHRSTWNNQPRLEANALFAY